MPKEEKYYFYGAPLHAQISDSMPLQERLSLTGNNTGNLFIAYAVERHLGTPAEWQLFGHDIDTDRINNEFDKVIIPASNFVNSYSDLGGVASILKKIKIPLVAIGIGSQASQFTDKIELKKGTMEFLQVLSERSVTLGARGNFTAEKLFDIGIKNVDVTGCPTIYFNSDPGFQINKKEYSPSFKVAVNFGRRKENLHLLKMAIKHKFPFFAQSELLELNVMDGNAGPKDIAKDPLYKKSGTIDSNELSRYLKTYGKVYYNLPDWITELSSYDFSIGPRLHGNMIAFQHGVPALWFTHDTRTKEIADLANLPNISILDIEKVTSLETFYDLADFSAFNRVYPLIYNNYIDFLERNQLQHTLTKAEVPNSERWNQLHSYDQYQRQKLELFSLPSGATEQASLSASTEEMVFWGWFGKVKSWLGENVRLFRLYLGISGYSIFDSKWYLETYQKRSKTTIGNPLWHYLKQGWKLGYNPSPLFDAAWYRRKYADVAEAGIEPLTHYLSIGWRERRAPSSLFDSSWYKKTYPAIPSNTNPFIYYLKHGWKLGHNPNPYFDGQWYLKNYSNISGEPLTHYIKIGWKLGFNPSDKFDAQAYLEKFPDVKASGMEPLTHFLRHGKREKRSA
jgi:hypothetical protein